ncbi:MAG: porin [Terriglobia bacterium]
MTRSLSLGIRCLALMTLTVCLSSWVYGQQAGKADVATGGANPAPLTDREQRLLDRIDKLEKRLAALEARTEGSKPTSAAPATPAAPVGPIAAAAPAAPAATAAPAAPVTASAPEAPASGVAKLLSDTSITGFVDAYYGFDANHPASRTGSFRAFDGPENQFSLNMIELIFDKAPDAKGSRLGYHLSFGYGNAMNVVNAADPAGVGFAQYLKEGYLSYLAPIGKGLQFDVGKFVTPAGNEVIESKDSWNYSRGLLFTYAVPFYHFGVRGKYTFNDKVSLTGYLVNGWNNIVDNNNGKTGGFSLAITPNKKFSLTENYLVGPEMANTNKHFRQLTDTIATYNPTSKLSLALNYDYGRGDMPVGYLNPVWWSGVAGYLRYAFTSSVALSTRYEYYDDHNGFTLGTAPAHINEVTETFEKTLHKNFITRLEFRYDNADQPIFAKASTLTDYQPTVTLGLIYVFDWKE